MEHRWERLTEAERRDLTRRIAAQSTSLTTLLENLRTARTGGAFATTAGPVISTSAQRRRSAPWSMTCASRPPTTNWSPTSSTTSRLSATSKRSSRTGSPRRSPRRCALLDERHLEVIERRPIGASAARVLAGRLSGTGSGRSRWSAGRVRRSARRCRGGCSPAPTRSNGHGTGPEVAHDRDGGEQP